MKKVILLVVLYFSVGIFYAQEVPMIKVGEERLGITSLDVKVAVVGNIATTTYDMLFYNPKSSVLEGELAFPLNDGQSVSRLALDVNGRLRESVVVEKEQGRIAFEAVVRRGVDPVLLEKGTGNNYKARIYPIPAKGHKRVVLAYEQELNYSELAHYFELPLKFTNTLDHFSIAFNVYGQEQTPQIISGDLAKFNFTNRGKDYQANSVGKNSNLNTFLKVKIPLSLKEAKIITNKDYAYIYKTLDVNKRIRSVSNEIDLYWDASYSMKDRDLQKEFAFLNEYFKNNSVKVNLLMFSNKVSTKKEYQIIDGDWSVLKLTLKNTIYDGGTSYNDLFKMSSAKEILLFSDGMKNLSELKSSLAKPHYIVNSKVKANHSELKKLALKTNGQYINLHDTTTKDAVAQILEQSFRYIGYSTDNPSLEVYPKTPQLVKNDFSVAIKKVNKPEELTLHFGYGDEITQEYKVLVQPKFNDVDGVQRLWAQKKLNYLNNDKENNKKEIIKLSKDYKVISDYTSLIVLETAWDYARYEIEPPSELLEEYNNIIASNKGKQIAAASQESEDIETEDAVIEESNVNTGTISNGTISGIVLDSDGLPLPGATVIVKGTTRGTTTDFDGRYSIAASTGEILSYSFVGYTPLETTIGGSSAININMTSDNALDEVVVTAQGIKREKKALGYAVTTIKSDEIEAKAEGDVGRLLKGKAPGVKVNSTGGMAGSGTNIIIRGYSSISGNNQPLFIVDGVPFSSGTTSQGSFVTGANGVSRFGDLDPNDIENISVLKGLSATALYGEEGKNGVILITTKSGKSQSYTTAHETPLANLYNGSLKLMSNDSKVKYIKELKKFDSLDEAYQHYLKQREMYHNSPGYYVDVFDFFKTKDEALAMKILSNIAEVDFDNYELLRAFAYKLEEQKMHELAVFIYKRVLILRPEDSQSYRDLALAYKDNGDYKAASDLLKSIDNNSIYKENSNRRKFDGMQQIVAREYNNVKRLNNAPEHEYRVPYNDVRIVVDWNHNDTDIDLHVIDPQLEECYYENTETRIGGMMTDDMTQGFGPEEYTVKNAVKGDYYIKVNYFGDRDQKVERPTFMKVTMFKNYGSKLEEKVVKVIRLDRYYRDQMVAKVSF